MKWLKRIRNHPTVWQGLRYLLPFFAILIALLTQGFLQLIIPKEADFPYAFFYLIAAFVSAWYGGYIHQAPLPVC